MLRGLGLAREEADVYQILLVESGLTVAELTRATALGARAVQRALDALKDKGLIGGEPGRNLRYSAAPPSLALDALVTRREEELKRARLEADELLRKLPAEKARRGGLPPVELIGGLEATRQRWVQIQRGASSEVCIIDRPPHVLSADAPNPVELELLEAGIGYRLLYDESSFDVPGKLRSAKACIAAGEQARVARDLPLKLVIADTDVALTYEPESHEIKDGLVVHRSPMLDALVRLFDLLWERATPFSGTAASEEESLDELDQEILTLLAAGAKDEVIARRIDVGVRTVRRRVAIIMERLGAKTRFEAAVKATKGNWV